MNAYDEQNRQHQQDIATNDFIDQHAEDYSHIQDAENAKLRQQRFAEFQKQQAEQAANQQEPIQKAEQAQNTGGGQGESAAAGGINSDTIPVVQHTTQSGKTSDGIIAPISRQEAKAIDKFAVQKEGGYFIHMDKVTPELRNKIMGQENEKTKAEQGIMQTKVGEQRGTKEDVQRQTNINQNNASDNGGAVQDKSATITSIKEQPPPTLPIEQRTPENRGEKGVTDQQNSNEGNVTVHNNVNEPWRMTANEYARHELDNNQYKKSYEENKDLLKEYTNDAKTRWRRQVEKAAENQVLPDSVIDSYIAEYGESAAKSVFRGVAAKGISEWEPKDVRIWDKTYKEVLKNHTSLTQKGEKRDYHRRAIADALSKGKPVPANVLAEYPELSKNNANITQQENKFGGKISPKSQQNNTVESTSNESTPKIQTSKGGQENAKENGKSTTEGSQQERTNRPAEERLRVRDNAKGGMEATKEEVAKKATDQSKDNVIQHTIGGSSFEKNATKKELLKAIDEAYKDLPEPDKKDGFSYAEKIVWPKTTTYQGRKTYELPGNYSLVKERGGIRWGLYKDFGKVGSEELIGKLQKIEYAKQSAENYLLGLSTSDGRSHVFSNANKDYSYTIPKCRKAGVINRQTSPVTSIW